MKLKLNEHGFAVVRDGKPVYTHADGREEAFCAPTAMKMLLNRHFETSAVAGGLKIPADIAATAFGDAFRINERGQLVAFDKGDIPIYSQTRHGEVANFEEALTQLIDRYPSKDLIQRKDGAPEPGQPADPGRTISRLEFDVLPHESRARFLKEGGTIGESANPSQSEVRTATPPSNGKTVTRSQFDVMQPIARFEHCRTGGKVVD